MATINGNVDECYICTEPFNLFSNTVKPKCCNNKVHKVCIQQWAAIGPIIARCPLCRARLSANIIERDNIVSPRVRKALVSTAKIALMVLVSASLVVAGFSVVSLGCIAIPAAILPTNAMLAAALQTSVTVIQLGVGVGLYSAGCFNIVMDASLARDLRQRPFLNESANTLKDCGQYLFRSFCIAAPGWVCSSVSTVSVIVMIDTIAYAIFA